MKVITDSTRKTYVKKSLKIKNKQKLFEYCHLNKEIFVNLSYILCHVSIQFIFYLHMFLKTRYNDYFNLSVKFKPHLT